MVVIFLVLAALFFGFGFAVHILWLGAVIFFVAWLAGFAFARGQRRAGGERRD